MNYHLGISAYYHDSAAALVADGRIISAAQQERFSRKKQDSGFPLDAVRFCIDQAGIELDQLSSVSYYEDPREKFRRTMSSFASAGPGAISTFGDIAPSWIFSKSRVLKTIDKELARLNRGTAPRSEASKHHLSHAASAFLPSPFKEAAVLCIDGVGEWHTTSIWHGQGLSLDLKNSISYPHSLGLLYSAFTYFCGFKVDSGEYKLMGLAPYGEPRFVDVIKDNLIELRQDGSFSLNLDYFEFLKGQKMVGEAFERLFGRPIRTQESELSQIDCDLAASIQVVTDAAVLGLAKAARNMTGSKNLCLAGGVALNCVSNGHLSKSGLFSNIWVQPAAGDAGCALGAAALSMAIKDGKRTSGAEDNQDAMNGTYLGCHFEPYQIQTFLDAEGIVYKHMKEVELLKVTAGHLADGAIVGWFQGSMEFGPRALGARSILGNPRCNEMQRRMNLKIKYRESFRPFAPSVLEEEAEECFELDHPSPYMLFVLPVAEKIRASGEPNRSLGAINEIRSDLPAITHVDFSARVQTVSDTTNPRYASLLREFKGQTGCPVLVNTSFNLRGEPIVCTPQDAYLCFMRTEMDVLVLGDFFILKKFQRPLQEASDWRDDIPLD